MAQHINPENLSPFGQEALKLDQTFAELERISGQLERLDIDSESGLDRAIKLLADFASHGEAITTGIANFSRTLMEARERSERAASSVGAKALEVRERQQDRSQLSQRLADLGTRVSGSLGAAKPEAGQLGERFAATDRHLENFLAEAAIIREEARRGRMKSLERSAESLCGTLESARRKLGMMNQSLH